MTITSAILSFLVLLNPIALFIYLHAIIEELPRKTFVHVLLKATTISIIILILFAILGDLIFAQVLSIRFASFQIFGGLVVVSIALLFIIQGGKSIITLRENLDDMASEIALPFMVGVTTVSLSVIVGNHFVLWQSVGIIIVALMVNFFAVILLLKIKYDVLKNSPRIVFDKTLYIFLRLNGFFLGAIGVDMILNGFFKIRG